MNNLLKYGLPSLLAVALASPAMAQNAGYNSQMGQNGNGPGYSQGGNYGEMGPNRTPNGTYGQNYSQNGGYAHNGPNGWNNGQSYSQNGWNGGQSFAPNNSNEQAVTRGFVAHVQRRLQQEGFYDNGNIDGLWGPSTQSALENFQQQHDLRVTGQIDMQTLAALNMMNGRQFGQNGNYQTFNHNYNQGQNYTSNSAGNNRAYWYGATNGQMNR